MDNFNNYFMTEDLSFLLWSVQGVKKIVNKGYATFNQRFAAKSAVTS